MKKDIQLVLQKMGEKLDYCPYDDEIIDICCELQDMKRHLGDGCPNGFRYIFLERNVDFYESKLVSLLFITVQENSLIFTGSMDLLPKVRNNKWSLEDLVSGIKKQVRYSNDILINDYVLDEDPFISFEKQYSRESNLEKNIENFINSIEILIKNTKISLGMFQWQEKYLKDELSFCREILNTIILKDGIFNSKI